METETKGSITFPYHEDSTTFPGPWHTIEQIKRHNESTGHHFFSPDTMRYFGSRVAPGLIAGRVFITSEQDRAAYSSPENRAWSGARRYTVRVMLDTGTIEEIRWDIESRTVAFDECFGAYASLGAARTAAHRCMVSVGGVLTMETETIVPDLTQSGDTHELDDGRVIRLLIEPDQDHSIDDDGDWYGQLSYAHFGNEPRPDGFNGNAEKINVNGDTYWWQPPEDVKRHDGGVDRLRYCLTDVMTCGWVGVIVELLEKCDHGCHHVIDQQSLWGIEWNVDPAYLQEVIEDLVGELNL